MRRRRVRLFRELLLGDADAILDTFGLSPMITFTISDLS